eukprot:3033879-Amphidinium_carterae.1
MVLPSSAKPSLSRHTARTYSASQSLPAATTVLRPDSMVSLSRWKCCLFASGAKLASSSRQSAASGRAPCLGMSAAD